MPLPRAPAKTPARASTVGSSAPPIALVRPRLTRLGLERVLLVPVGELAPRLFRWSRRGARLAERVGVDRPALTLSSLLAELSADKATGIPTILVDKLAFALHRLIDDERELRGARGDDIAVAQHVGIPPLPEVFRPFLVRLDALEQRLRQRGARAAARGKRARVVLEEDPPGFLYTEEAGAFAPGALLRVEHDPLEFVGVRGALPAPDVLLYALDRVRDVVLEPVQGEEDKLLRMLRPKTAPLLDALDALAAPSSLDDAPATLAWQLKGGVARTVRPVVHGAEALVSTARKGLVDVISALPFATQLDVRIARRIADVGDELDLPLAELLERHPRVELHDGRPVRFVAATPGVVLDAERRLGFVVDGVPVSALELAHHGGGVVVDAERGRALMVMLEPRERALAGAIANLDGPLVDATLPDVLDKLRRIGGRLEVRVPEALRGRRVPPERRVEVRIAWLEGGGARVAVVARPLAGGASFVPGEGSLEVWGEDARDGAPVWCARERDDEIARASRLFDELGFSGDPEIADGPWRVALLSRGAVLDVLAALSERDDVIVAFARAPIAIARATPEQLRVRLTERRDWLGVDGAVQVDEHTRVSLHALLQALREDRHYVVVDAQQIVAISQQLVHALGPLASVARDPRGRNSDDEVQLSRAGAMFVHDLIEGGVVVDGWDARSVDIEALRRIDGTPPPGLRAQLRPYQEEGVRFLRRLAAWGTGGVLADDMGLGKTLMALALLVDRSAGPALVVAPTSLGFNWARELERFTALRPRLYGAASTTERAEMLRDAGARDVVIVSYGLVQRDPLAFAGVRFATLILDEAQAVKNAGTARRKAVAKLQADARFALTGTPIENHLGELWSLLDVVAPGVFGTWDQFKARFAQPIEKHDDGERKRLLGRALVPFLLRRKKRDVARDLPPRTDVTRLLDLSSEERAAYDRLQQALVLELEGDDDDIADLEPGQQRMRVLAAITRLRLCACHPSLVADALATDVPPVGTKLQALVALVQELRDSGHRVLVFSQFVRHLELARRALEQAGASVRELTGATRPADRERLVVEFQRGDVDAFLISLKAGGFGLNLTRASYVVHLDPWWNPAAEDQASDRAHRIGQTEPVTVVRLVARDTVEEQILQLHETKRALVDGILEGTDAAQRMSVDDLVSIVRHTRRHGDDGVDVAYTPASAT